MSEKNRKKAVFFSIPLVVAALLGTAAISVGSRGGLQSFLTPDRIHQLISWKIDDAMQEINVSKDQRQQINEIKDRLFTDGAALREPFLSAHEVFEEEWDKEKPNLERINRELDQIFEVKREFASRLAQGLIEVHDVLTPQQRQQLADIHKKQSHRFDHLSKH